MKLADILKDLDAEKDPDEILIEVTSEILKRCGLQITLESRWEHSGHKDWMYRVDPENPSIPLKRHIHIARSKHTSSKGMQASWNDDGSRHDRGSFNTSVGDTARVREIARSVLSLPPNVTLESAGSSRAGASFVEEAWFSTDRKIAYVSIRAL